jgi:L-alanine-DL-glutamate epimerase-like enolase superfamily enzyme
MIDLREAILLNNDTRHYLLPPRERPAMYDPLSVMPSTSPAQTTSRSRRDFWRKSIGAMSAAALSRYFPSELLAETTYDADHPLTIESITRTSVRLPFRPVAARNMARELPHWEYFDIFEVKLKSGVVGVGEGSMFYSWGFTREDDIARVKGQNAASLMWDDSLGPGLQIALFDAVARQAGVPVHALLGHKVNDQTPVSWWAIEMNADDWLLECQDAVKNGYKSFKTKGRPWMDVYAQVETIAKSMPESFKVNFDFNDTLLDAERGIPVVKELARHAQMDIFESPIPQQDAEGNVKIRQATRVKIAMHYGTPSPEVVVKTGCCDGFVVGGGATKTLKHGFEAEETDRPFWLQLVGTGVMAAWSAQMGGVLKNAKWPAVNCHQLYEHTLLKEPFVVQQGKTAVKDLPGLGYELDREALRKYTIERPKDRPDPPRLVKSTWTDGTVYYTANTGKVNFMLTAGQKGVYPYFKRGVRTELVPNDGSAKWKELWEKAQSGPVRG